MNTAENNSTSSSNKPMAAYLVQRSKRTRYSFGSVWTEAVKEGTVSDKDKLLAHAVKLKVGTKSALKNLRMETLLAKVQKALAH